MASHATQEKGMERKRDRVCAVAARRTEPHVALQYIVQVRYNTGTYEQLINAERCTERFHYCSA